MLEIEAKARIGDMKLIEKRILDIGGKFLKVETQADTYFRHPFRDFSKTDEALRVREIDKRYFLTYKGPKIDKITKTRKEIEVGFSDIKNVREILHRLGFKKVLNIVKKRKYFALGEFSVMMDKVKGLGNFVEIEKHTDTYKPDELVRLIKKLGINEDAMERRSYLELMLEL